ncbi:hypothetical protein FBQ85_11190 [Cytophagia bacterium CHB2]|nr:hypothetical protein [Cytophagia bacterium CHB2]
MNSLFHDDEGIGFAAPVTCYTNLMAAIYPPMNLGASPLCNSGGKRRRGCGTLPGVPLPSAKHLDKGSRFLHCEHRFGICGPDIFQKWRLPFQTPNKILTDFRPLKGLFSFCAIPLLWGKFSKLPEELRLSACPKIGVVYNTEDNP